MVCSTKQETSGNILLVIGAAVLDRIFKTEKLPRPGETVIGSDMTIHPGGKGCNQALAAVRMGARVRLFTAVGDDADGDYLLAPLLNAGVDCSSVIRHPTLATATAALMVDREGNNMIAAYPGAYGSLTADHLSPSLFDDVGWLLVQNEIPQPVTNRAIEMAQERGVKVVFNPAPFRAEDSLPNNYVDYLIPNEIEASGILSVPDYTVIPVEDRCRLWRDKAKCAVIVTLGKQGGERFVPNGSYYADLPTAVKTRDTVGAGDAFCGILTALLADGIPLDRAVAVAHWGAAQSTTYTGAQTGLPSRLDIPPHLNPQHDTIPTV